ncbi:hypothetical protein ACWCQK_33470 [Streptomyces sp. NPDC002306]
MTVTIANARTGFSLPGRTVDGTGSGRHRGMRADEDGWSPEGDFAGHGRHRGLDGTAWLPSADTPGDTRHDAAGPTARDESAGPDREHRVADGLAALAALEALILREKALGTDRAHDL